MTDIVLEVIRAVIVGVILAYLWSVGRREDIRRREGWWYIFAGFALLFFGILIDVTDNFPSLNRYIIIGDTEYQAFLEKVVGYLLGFLLLAIGFWKWLPTVVALGEAQRALERSHDELEIKVEQRTDTLKATNEQLRQEIAERTRAEEEIKRLAKFPSENPNPVLRITEDGTIIYANEASLPLLNVWGRQTGRPLPDDWRQLTLDAISSGLRKEAEVEYEDRILSLTFAPVVDAHYVNIYGLDVTARKRAEEALKEYSGQLEDMVEERTRELREAQAQLLAQQRLQQEIELAAQVQTSLLPRGVPSLEGFDFAATALPARYVSGDMYDFILSDSEACHIVLADIAGKGIPAAMLTSMARALVRAETEHEDSPATILSNVNTSLYEDLTLAEVFITFLAARLNARLGTLTYANAGHTETLWWQQTSRTCRTLPATGMPLGIDADAPILEETLTLRPGDVLVFYSDGITEAANPHDELLGLDRLIAILSKHTHLPASELTQAIVEAVETFRAGAPLSDDLTLIVLKVLPRTISFTYPATLDHLNEVTALVQQVASAYGSDFAYQMELVTSEIVTNVIEHAYRLSSGEMRGQITLLPDQIQLDLYDDGTPFDPSQAPASDLTEELQDRGRGLFVARQLTDELTYNPATPEGNHWRLIKLSQGG